MKMNQYRGDSEPFGVLYSANDTVERTAQESKLDRAAHNRVLKVANSPSDAVAAPIADRKPFPLRTLMVCFTIWLIATQAMIFDQIRFDERVHLLEQETRSLGVPQMTVPYELQSKLPTGANPQRL